MNESNWVRELNESYLKEIGKEFRTTQELLELAQGNMSIYMSQLKSKLTSMVAGSEPHVDEFIKENVLKEMTPLHHERIASAASDQLDVFSSHTANHHAGKLLQYVTGKSGGQKKSGGQNSNSGSWESQ